MRNKTLCLAYCDSQDLLSVWHAAVPEYHYQDQTDRPDDISYRDWEKRKNEWNRVLGGDGWGIPADHGFSFEFLSKNSSLSLIRQPIDVPRLLKLLPSFKSRVVANSKEIFISRYTARKTNKLSDEEKQSTSISKYFFEAIDLIQKKDAEYLKILKQTESKMLPYKKITEKILTTPITSL